MELNAKEKDAVSGACPKFFKAHVMQAMTTGHYEEAGYHLAIHAFELVTQDVSDEVAEPLFKAALDADDAAGALEALLRRCLPRCMELVLPELTTFVAGLQRAIDEGRVC